MAAHDSRTINVYAEVSAHEARQQSGSRRGAGDTGVGRNTLRIRRVAFTVAYGSVNASSRRILNTRWGSGQITFMVHNLPYEGLIGNGNGDALTVSVRNFHVKGSCFAILETLPSRYLTGGVRRFGEFLRIVIGAGPFGNLWFISHVPVANVHGAHCGRLVRRRRLLSLKLEADQRSCVLC